MGDRLHLGFKLDSVTVIPVRGELVSGQGKLQRVPPRAMEVLLCLAREPGQLVSRRRLREMVWGRNPVSDDALTRCVRELRQLLGDVAEDPRFIQTIPGRGYRLIPEPRPINRMESEYPEDRGAGVAPGVGLFAELRRRKVFRVGASYAVVAWLVLQVADVVLDALPLPEGSMTFLIVALAMGFPVSLVLAWVFELTPQGVKLDATAGEPGATGGAQGVHPMVYAVGAVSALAVGMLAYLLTSGSQGNVASAPPQESIAVLPFVNMSDSAQNEYFSDGLTEEILNVLARISELQVASRTSAFYFKGKDLEITDIASRLSVRYVLEGSVRLSGATMRVTAQLIDGENGFHLWSETYDRSSKDIFAVQSDIAQQVARNLKLVLSSASRNALARPPTDNYEAYDFYLRGRDYLRRPQAEDNLENALRMFDQAVTLDPAFALAQAGICETRLLQYRRNTEPALFEQAERACHRALTRGRDSVEVLVALGTLHQVSGQLDAALEEFDRAIAAQPRFAAAHMGRADVLDLAGRTGEAEAGYKEAIEIDRGYWEGFQALGNFYFENGRYAEAVQQYQEVIRRTPDNASAFNNVGAAYFLMGDFQSAAEIWLKSLEILPSMSAYSNVGTMYYYLGRFEDAIRMFQKAVDLAPERYLFRGGLADAMIQLPSRHSEALQAYRKAAELVDQALRINPGDADAMAEGARYRAALGEHERAAQLIDAASAVDPGSYYLYYNKAQVQIAAGELALAEESLMRAVELGFQRDLLAVDAAFAVLRGRPRFEALVGKRPTASD